ncbi:hypothetical protein EFD55_01995 [Rhizobium pisi]|uniref:Uncharacterized protein n=1 Tax=Rhizobium pisi TaxID=574561 RepID=A0A3R9B2N7_9HYPH|nr:hypothetical protein EFD55_01995 [Rhizobium pisi]
MCLPLALKRPSRLGVIMSCRLFSSLRSGKPPFAPARKHPANLLHETFHFLLTFSAGRLMFENETGRSGFKQDMKRFISVFTR